MIIQEGRYRSVVFFQLLLLLADFFINSFVYLLRYENVVLLVLYILQDIFIVFSVIVMFLLFFNTYVFQAGLIRVLVRKFKITIVVTGLYFVISVCYHIWDTNVRWDDPNSDVWSDGLLALYVVQRIVAVLHYYLYKRTALRLADPHFYKDSQWLREELAGIPSHSYNRPR